MKLKSRILTKLTSVKIISDLYHRFKKKALDDNITLQQIVNRSIELYLSDDEIRNKISNFTYQNEITGSQY